jgi:alpha-mannosidase
MKIRMWSCGGALLLACIASGGPGQSWAQEPPREKNLVWQLGEFDQTSREFGRNFDFESDKFRPVYTVGQSKTADWPAVQVSSIGDPRGKHSPAYTIVFRLPEVPKVNYTLKIAVLLVNPAVPDLTVEINGRKGRYYFDRKISYYPGDDRIDSPIYGGDELNIDVPGRFLKAGENTLILRAAEDSDNPGASSSLIYDALQLAASSKEKPEPSATVKPTVFYKQRGNQFQEVTRVTVTSPEKLGSGSLELTVGTQRFHGKFSVNDDFGQARVDFDVPEFAAGTAGSVAIHTGGGTYHSNMTLTPERKWSIYFVPHAHLDIGYTDYQAKVVELQNRNIDKLLDFLPKNPSMRFSLDGSWVARNYLETRNQDTQNKFMQFVHEGRISIPAQYASLLTGYASLEELIRSLLYAHSLHQTENVPFEYANITDVPSVTWSYPSVLNAAGVKYFAEATNSDRGPIVLYGKWNEKSPFWRVGPDGSKVLMANTRQYSQLWFVCELPPEAGQCRQGLPGYLQQFAAPDYRPDAVLMFGSQLENTDVRLSEPDFLAAWNAEYAYPKFIISSFPDYFKYIEQKFGSQLATVNGDGGPYWEDGVATDANNTSIDRSNQSRAVSAEELATVSRYLNPGLAAPRQLTERIWTNLLLYAEHTWDSWDSVYRPDSEESVGQLATKDHYVAASQQAVNALVRQSMSQIADQIHMPAGSMVIFNTLSWPRSGLVETDLERGMALTEYPERIPVAFEVLREGPGYWHVRFLAKDIPAMGFKCYSLVARKEGQDAQGPTLGVAPDTMGNDYYRVQVDAETGAVKSIYDKELKRELVDSASAYKFNQYLYVQGGAQTQIVYMRKSLPFAQLTVTPSSGGRVVGLKKTPYGQILTVEAKSVRTPSVRSEIILFDGEKKIEFVNRVTKDAVREKEAGYFAFPIAAAKPAFSYEIQNGWVDPSKNMLKGAGLEWFNVMHWAKASGGDWDVAIVPVDAPLITLGDINRGVWPEQFTPKSATIFSYAFNNYWHTNYRADQGGEMTFRYVMTSGTSLTPESLARFGRAEMTPLEKDQVIDQDKVGNPERPLRPVPVGFLQVDAADVVVETWKAAEDGRGTIVRLLETGGRESKVRLQFPMLAVQRAWLTNAMEEDAKEIAVTGSAVEVPLEPLQIVTVRIVGTFQTAKQ